MHDDVRLLLQQREAEKLADTQYHLYNVICRPATGEITFDKSNRVRLAGAISMIKQALLRQFEDRALRVGVRSLSDSPPCASVKSRMGDILVYTALSMDEVSRTALDAGLPEPSNKVSPISPAFLHRLPRSPAHPLTRFPVRPASPPPSSTTPRRAPGPSTWTRSSTTSGSHRW